jgi:hypothetical protein
MISAISQNDSTSNSSTASAATAATGTSQVTKNMFLQLLVAQIKNQDPMSALRIAIKGLDYSDIVFVLRNLTPQILK